MNSPLQWLSIMWLINCFIYWYRGPFSALNCVIIVYCGNDCMTSGGNDVNHAIGKLMGSDQLLTQSPFQLFVRLYKYSDN
jgi:hypothetical protein